MINQKDKKNEKLEAKAKKMNLSKNEAFENELSLTLQTS